MYGTEVQPNKNYQNTLYVAKALVEVDVRSYETAGIFIIEFQEHLKFLSCSRETVRMVRSCDEKRNE